MAALTAVRAAAPLYFPFTDAAWARVSPAEAGWNETALAGALEYAGTRQSSGVVVLLGGRILAERHWDVAGPAGYTRTRQGRTPEGHSIEDVASAQKSIVAFLAGVAERERLLSLDTAVDRYLGQRWSKAAAAAESQITVRHLMTMTSGLDDSLAYRQPAGAEWRYNTGAYSRMIPILEKAAGADIAALTERWLTGPTGMASSRWVTRPWAVGNDAANAIGFATTARDLARFGLLVLNRGAWRDRDLLQNPSYLDRMLAPSQTLNRSYGLLWWLNGQSGMLAGGRRHASLIPGAPSDLVAAVGAMGRKCYVVPSLQLVVTRIGADPGEAFDEELWTRLMTAAPVTDR
jgi:CubicO group peptidase (beta-lactamase class C family)